MAMLRRSGRVDFLRANELGSKFGGGQNQIDVEIVARISSEPDHFFGATLRNDDRLPSHQAMFQLLRDGLANDDLETTIDYDIDVDNGRKTGRLVRVELRPS